MAISDAWGSYNETQELQSLFQKNGIPIDLETNTNVNAMLCFNTTGAEGVYPFRKIQSDSQKRDAVLQIKNLIDGIYAGDGCTLVFKPGEESPRIVSRKPRGGFELSEPLDQIKAPKRPNWFKRFVNSFTPFFNEEMADYKQQEKAYLRVRAILDNPSYAGAVEQHKTNASHMYDFDIKEAMEESVHNRETSIDHKKILNEKLDELFEPVEENGLGSRMDYISIEGKTVHALLHEEYIEFKAQGNEGINFEEYCTAHPERGNEMILSALAGGKRVDCFVPDDEGVLPQKATQLKPEGDLAIGIAKYKDLLPKLPEDDARAHFTRLTETRRNMQNVAAYRAYNEHAFSGMDVKEKMFGDTVMGELQNPLGFSVTRTGLVSLTYAYLANEKNLPIDELMDPSCYLLEKYEAGQEIMERCQKGDAAWISEQIFLGGEKISKALNDKLLQMPMNSPADFLMPENLWMGGASGVLFDLWQEQSHVSSATENFITKSENPEAMKKRWDALCESSKCPLSMPHVIAKGQYESSLAQLGFMDEYKSAVNPISGRLAFDYIKDCRETSPSELDLQLNIGAVKVALSFDEELFEQIGGGTEDTMARTQQQAELCKLIDKGVVTKVLKLEKGEGGLFTLKQSGQPIQPEQEQPKPTPVKAQIKVK